MTTLRDYIRDLVKESFELGQQYHDAGEAIKIERIEAKTDEFTELLKERVIG